MTLEELLTALRVQGDASGYLNDPNANPAVGRAQRYPSGIPLPNATLGADGMRLPLPRIQGGAPPPRIVANPQQRYPLVYGPSVGAENQLAPAPTPPMQTAPVMRFRDANATVGPAMMDQPAPQMSAQWAQPEQINAGPAVSANRLPIGAPPIQRGLEPPSAPQTPVDDDAEWNAAAARVRSVMNMESLERNSRKPARTPTREMMALNRFPNMRSR